MSTQTLKERHNALQQQVNGAIAFIALSAFFVGLKLLALHLRNPNGTKRRIALDWGDGLILVSLMVFAPLCAFAIVNAKASMAYYETSARSSQKVHYATIAKSSYVVSVLYTLASTLPRMSLCMLYLRVFGVHRRVRQANYILLAFLITNAIAWAIPTIAICKPISGFWSLPQRNCLNYNILGAWKSLPNILSDIVMFMLPLQPLWHMQIGRSKKIGVMIMFAAGSLGIVGACLRFSFYIHRTYVVRPGTAETTRSAANTMIVTYLECGMYLIAACLPSLRPIFVQIHRTLSSILTSVIHRYRSSKSHYLEDQESAVRPTCKCQERQEVDVKLTGIGNLATLRREGGVIGASSLA